MTGDKDLDWTTTVGVIGPADDISAISTKQATSEQVNVRGLFLFHPGKTFQTTYGTIVYRTPQPLPAVTPLFLSPACCETLQIGNVLERQRALLTQRFIRTASSFAVTKATFFITARDRSPFVIPDDVSMRPPNGVSAQTAKRSLGSPPFLACP